MTSQHKTNTHPFYIGMYIHIYTHIYVHKYTSQKECLHIFFGRSISMLVHVGTLYIVMLFFGFNIDSVMCA